MSIQEIVKYATSTPHNTNPAVLKSMLEQEKHQFVHEVFSNPIKEREKLLNLREYNIRKLEIV